MFVVDQPDEGLDDPKRREKYAMASKYAVVRVQDAEGSTITGAEVTLVLGAEAGPDPFRQPLRTGSGGTVFARELLYDGYWADVTAPGFAPVRISLNLAADGLEADESIAVIEPARSVAIEVSSSDATAPIREFHAQLDYNRPGSANMWWMTISGSRGSIQVPIGREFWLHVESRGFEPWERTIDDQSASNLMIVLNPTQ